MGVLLLIGAVVVAALAWPAEPDSPAAPAKEPGKGRRFLFHGNFNRREDAVKREMELREKGVEAFIVEQKPGKRGGGFAVRSPRD
jgi:hypothetical protein